jgi:phospholipid transport system substrate-binding protein
MILFISLFCMTAFAGTATEAVDDTANEVIAVLKNKSLGTAAKKERLEVIYKRMFDEVELSRLSLGRNCNKLTASQQQEFVQLFRKTLENAYANKITDYKDEKVKITGERALSADRAEVQTKVISASKGIPVLYRLKLKEGKWKVYDVVIENVSLVQNYRAQFREILMKNSPDQLIEILRKKAISDVGKPSRN